MHFRRISYHKTRRGMSAILGTLIFVGILFSAFIPMYLTMKQADTLYEREMLELKRLDDERDRELIYAYAYPKSATSDQVEIKVENLCEVTVGIARVWINDTYVNQGVSVASMNETFLGPFSLPVNPAKNSSYTFRVVSERGNVYVPISGSVLAYDNGEWDTQYLSVNVMAFCSESGGICKYKVTVTNSSVPPYEWEDYNSDYVTGTQFFYFDVTESGEGDYHVKIEAKPIWKSWRVLHEEDVEIEYPSGPPDVWVRYSE